MYITITDRDDGFGAQLQHILFGMVYAEHKGYTYVHKPIISIEHNYENDPLYIEKLEEFLNIRGNFKTISDIETETETETEKEGQEKLQVIPFWTLYPFVCENFDICLEGSKAIRDYKVIFWEKKQNIFPKEVDVIHIAVHVRRFNSCDWDISRIQSDSYFLNVIQKIREKYNGKKVFHIYSQGSQEEFCEYDGLDIIFHLNEDLRDTFVGMVSADILVTSKSALSYCAALLTDGTVYFIEFGCFNPPSRNWIYR